MLLGVKCVAHASLIIQSLVPILIHVWSGTECLNFRENFTKLSLFKYLNDLNWKNTCPEFAHNYHWNQLVDVKVYQIYNVMYISEKSCAHFHRNLGTLINGRIWTCFNQFGSKCLVEIFGTNAYARKDEMTVVVIAIAVFHRWRDGTI